MAIQAPEWLTRRGGELRLGVGDEWWSVVIDRVPLYRVEPVPVTGKHGCKITVTNNGKLIPCTGTYDTAEDAVRGGLEDLRKALGW